MTNLNNKGFTLVEVIAVVVVIALIGMIAVPSVLSIINSSKQSSYYILTENIAVAGKELFEEIDYIENKLYHYNTDGVTSDIIVISGNEITVSIQTLVSNGFLTGNNNPDREGSNKNYKIVTHPDTKEDIGTCEIVITKIVDSNYKVSYKIDNNSSSNSNCPTTEEYNKALGIKEGE